MKTYDNEILHYFNTLLSANEQQILIDNDVPLYGEYGIRRFLAERSIEAFVKLYFFEEFYLDFPEIHYKILSDLQTIRDRQIADKPGLKLARAIPRNHAKSTFYSRILPLHGFLFDWSKLTVLLGNNEDSARRLVANIKNAIENNAAIIQDFPEIKGSAWGYEKLQSNTGATITSYGVGSGSIRGISNPKRPSLVILDDVDDDRSVRSAVELANNIDWFNRAVMALGDNVTYTTTYIAVGTIIRKTSLMKYILDSADFDSIVEQRIKQWSSNAELWSQWELQYLELAKEGNQPKDATEDVFYQENKTALLNGTQVLWNKKDEYYNAMVYKLARGNNAFNSEMQNNPTDNNGALGTIKLVNIDGLDTNDYIVLSALDPTITGNKNSDLSAHIEILFNQKRKEMIVSYVDAKQRSYGETIEAIVNRIKSRGLYSGFWIETNAAGSIITDLLQERFNRDGIPMIADGVYNSIPKAERINTLSEYINRSQLLFADSLPDTFFEELNNWPLSKTDDQLDAVAIIVLELRKRGLIDLIEINYSTHI